MQPRATKRVDIREAMTSLFMASWWKKQFDIILFFQLVVTVIGFFAPEDLLSFSDRAEHPKEVIFAVIFFWFVSMIFIFMARMYQKNEILRFQAAYVKAVRDYVDLYKKDPPRHWLPEYLDL